MNVTFEWMMIAAVWIVIGAIAGYFFLILIDLSTRSVGGMNPGVEWHKFLIGWAARIGGIGVLMFFAVRQDVIYAILFVIAFSIANGLQVGAYRRRADAMDRAARSSPSEERKEKDDGRDA